ncbi:beta-lactamase/transpeptidase-like protein [Mytilinidion resinicola]|uniref:Beta-lactamase/transpeptidase-like protein n=1 Tax=Mytilinidion resinicola TaxID=574789 RepID=A0A6A6YSB8_9PEZI|nr:beta-lactamase/transpeptidase-like protein [Mytilinidion resinicola]KAF2810807.1 beta-lactamase/transpeptidase-like protein [Mytilinidion resinicola]
MSDQAPILDSELEGDILRILKACGTHMASISVRSLSKPSHLERTTVQLQTFMRLGDSIRPGAFEYKVSSDGKNIFHIASITKILVAVAIVIAVEIKAKEQVVENPYAAFSNVPEESLTTLYNDHSKDKMPSLPGNPSLYQLLVHFRGLRSSNHYLLAPDGSPIMTMADLLQDLTYLSKRDAGRSSAEELWTKYSNINYSLIAIAIEALWKDTLSTFMSKTLFEPLGMMSTTIGSPTDRGIRPERYVVDSNGTLHCVRSPEYQSTGAEAGALGAFSSAEDLDKFFTFLITSLHGKKVIEGFDVNIISKLFKLESRETKENVFTGLGLLTTLNSSKIGSMSTNALLFPDETFSTYPVSPGSRGKGIEAYYMAGSALGCNCTTAFLPSVVQESFAVVVLTDTSGPVDAADHISRRILQTIAKRRCPQKLSLFHRQPENVMEMVKKAWDASSNAWKRTEKKDEQLIKNAPNVSKNITGVFKGKGFSQWLIITTADLKTYITVCGSNDSRTSSASGSSSAFRTSPAQFQLIWVNANLVKMCVPPHLSIDTHGDGDWSELTFEVHCSGNTVTELIRMTAVGKDCFERTESGTPD